MLGDNKNTNASNQSLCTIIMIQRLRAASKATSADEHAVSIVMEGPCKPRVYDIRFDLIDVDNPVAEKGLDNF